MYIQNMFVTAAKKRESCRTVMSPVGLGTKNERAGEGPAPIYEKQI
jgi:hypothetical protein